MQNKTDRILADYLSIKNCEGKEQDQEQSGKHTVANMKDIRDYLLNTDWSFSDDDTGYLTHDMHPYPAKFIPQIPNTLIKLLSRPGDVIWDPFGGSGTTALEAILNRRTFISTDINPIGEIIGRAKTVTLSANDEKELGKFLLIVEQLALNETYLREYIATRQEEITKYIPNIPHIEKWFSQNAICELAVLKQIINYSLTTSEAVYLAKASLSKIITRVSNQESETRYTAKEKDVPNCKTLMLFIKDLKENITKTKALGSLFSYSEGQFLTLDVMSRIVGPNLPIKNDSVDLIVTSPPYPNAFDYHLYHRFRIFWLDGNPVEMGKVEIGSHLKYQKQKKGFDEFENEMKKVLTNCYMALKNGKYAVFVLGDAVFEKETYKTAEAIGKVAEQIGFSVIDIITRELPENKRSIQSFARRAKEEKLLVLQKPEKDTEVSLIPVGYKLWPYEKEISKKEVEALFGTSVHNDRLNVNTNKLSLLKRLTFYKAYSIGGSVFPTWQSIIESGFEKRVNKKDPKYVTHGIHPYKGKFYPQLVRPLLNIYCKSEGETILDPFCGSGTIALECAINGYRALGCDINPLAIEIAKAKTDILFVDPCEIDKQISILVNELSNYNSDQSYDSEFSSDAIDEIYSWFPNPVANKIGFVLNKIRLLPEKRIKCFLTVILSSIIREVSQQEPRDLRIRRRNEPIEDAPVLELFVDNLECQLKRVFSFFRIRNLAPNQIIEPYLWLGNATDKEVFHSHVKENSVDLVITSPPYATALPYIDTNRLNLLILEGLNASKRIPIENELTGTREIKISSRKVYDDKIRNHDYQNIISTLAKDLISQIYLENSEADVGFRRKNMAALLYMYFSDMTEVMQNIDYAIKKDGHICIVIGDTQTTTGTGTRIINTAEILKQTCELLGWKLKETIPISVTTENYMHIENAITKNVIFVFKK